ncbi:MAG TPA: DUF3596 domain-containing protein [Acidimicrobiia bacterium]
MTSLGDGIRVKRGKIQIRYAVAGQRYEEMLPLTPTNQNIEKAEQIRSARMAARELGFMPARTGFNRDEIERAASLAFRAARKRGGVNYRLTRADEQAIFTRSRGACQVTGIPFDVGRSEKWSRSPFAPSVDRIDSSEGYIPGNVRLVCVAVNLAMNQWGERVFALMANAYVEYNGPYFGSKLGQANPVDKPKYLICKD